MSVRADIASFESVAAEQVLAWAFEEFGDGIALVTALQAEGLVLLDMAHRLGASVRVITGDTGRLPEETYELIDRVRERYDVHIEVLVPNAESVEAMVRTHGVNLFTRSPELRRLCCEVRKTFPLERALAGLDAWITGLRRSQSKARAATPKVGIDKSRGIVKVSPLADWNRERVWSYIRRNGVPYNTLYDRGYATIGCAPCTRAIGPGEHERAGRWWWEGDGKKECGLHERPPEARHEEGARWPTSR